ncbi:MAG: SDR family NAD(P)-dependent oxidoreductase [Pseudomonas sp.]
MKDLTNSNVLIIGGSSGIGAATAQAFAALGAQVTIASRNQSKLDAVANSIGANVRTLVLDTTDEAAVSAFFSTAGTFDHVVISAAQTPGGPVRKLALDDAYAAMNSKFWGAYRVARVVSINAGGSLTFVSGFLSGRPRQGSGCSGYVRFRSLYHCMKASAFTGRQI